MQYSWSDNSVAQNLITLPQSHARTRPPWNAALRHRASASFDAVVRAARPRPWPAPPTGFSSLGSTRSLPRHRGIWGALVSSESIRFGGRGERVATAWFVVVNSRALG